MTVKELLETLEGTPKMEGKKIMMVSRFTLHRIGDWWDFEDEPVDSFQVSKKHLIIAI